MDIEEKISPLIQHQFPAFYAEEGPNFIAFVKAYYEWMEQTGNPIGESRSLSSNLDVDSSVEEFASHFKNMYLAGIPSGSALDRNFSIKHIQDLYKAKGTSEAEKLLFRLVFNTHAEIHKPGEEVLRPSSGVWNRPKYIEIEYSDATAGLVGKLITGATSGAKAFVESAARRNVNSKIIDVLYLTDIVGDFQVNEYITADGNLIEAPKIIGSLTSVNIVDAGFGISNGDVFDINSNKGSFGQLRIVTTINGSGQVEFTLVDGGSGYSVANSVVTVSNSVVFHSGNVSSANVSFTNFANNETITQNVFNFTVANSGISNGSLVSVYNGANTLLGNGVVSSVNATTVQVGVHTGNLSTAAKVLITINPSVNSTITGVSDISRTAKVLTANSTAVGITNVSNTFIRGAFMRGATSNVVAINTRTSTGSNATFSVGTVIVSETVAGQQIGKISSLSSVNPGTNYDTPPMVRIDNPMISGNNKYDFSLTLSNVSGQFIVGQNTKTSANVSGIVREVANTTFLKLRRVLFADTISTSQQLVSYFANGTVSGTATISAVANDTSYPVMGLNAIVNAYATSLSGVVSETEIINSGLGYEQDEQLTFISTSNTNVTFTGTANILNQGQADGFWKDNRGKLNSVNRIHDNDYYQDFSYEIQTELSIDKYSDILKKLFHISGTKMFGKVVKNTGETITLSSNSYLTQS